MSSQSTFGEIKQIISELSANTQEAINTFVRESTKIFDNSHNYEHADIVYKNTILIANDSGEIYEDDIVTLAAKLHDVRDHKYPNSITMIELEKFIMSITNCQIKTDRILRIIDNVSFSKQDAGKSKTLDEPDNKYLTWIRDADRLEAIGQIGIDRCRAFTKSKNPDASLAEIDALVIKHCHEKLLRLYNEQGFIVTKLGREIAAPLHKIIVDFVAKSN
jgi:uncharacterized protein